ncbi:unnamed protein product [Periconia digitata]|uniref:Uncharacterized protein n=1 Tax=Periconia digitata TaxID=1303443 RepID=A0A9W4XYX5_9PLEO|nr:unnamed protein product [Periconia digitata]
MDSPTESPQGVVDPVSPPLEVLPEAYLLVETMNINPSLLPQTPSLEELNFIPPPESRAPPGFFRWLSCKRQRVHENMCKLKSLKCLSAPQDVFLPRMGDHGIVRYKGIPRNLVHLEILYPSAKIFRWLEGLVKALRTRRGELRYLCLAGGKRLGQTAELLESIRDPVVEELRGLGVEVYFRDMHRGEDETESDGSDRDRGSLVAQVKVEFPSDKQAFFEQFGRITIGPARRERKLAGRSGPKKEGLP